MNYPKERKLKVPSAGTCVVCGKECPRLHPNGRWRRRTGVCSARCGYERRKAKKGPRKTCPECKKVFWPRRNGKAGDTKFCDRHCRLAYENKRRWVDVPCAKCGTPVRKDRNQLRRHRLAFCSKECSSSYQTGEHSPSWRGGSDPNRGHEWRKLAEDIRRRDGYKCRWCGCTQEENGQKLSVDHVRPWREFEDKAQANDPVNLVSLCRRCHSRKGGLERRWLRGDLLALQEYRRMVGLS